MTKREVDLLVLRIHASGQKIGYGNAGYRVTRGEFHALVRRGFVNRDSVYDHVLSRQALDVVERQELEAAR